MRNRPLEPPPVGAIIATAQQGCPVPGSGLSADSASRKTPLNAQLTDTLLTFFHNHLPLFGAAAGVLLLLIANEVHGNLTGGRKLGPLEAVRLINDREPLLLDLRAPADFKKAHLLNAINLPLAKIDARIGEIGKDKTRPVIVYDALGGGVDAVTKLRKLGFAEVYPLRGGLNGWLSSNLPVTSK